MKKQITALLFLFFSSDANRQNISIVLSDTFPDGNQISKIFKKPVHEDRREQNLGGESREWELMCANEREKDRDGALYSIIWFYMDTL